MVAIEPKWTGSPASGLNLANPGCFRRFEGREMFLVSLIFNASMVIESIATMI
jgi:hypothetical protein